MPMDVKAIKEAMKELEGAGSADRQLEVLRELETQFKPNESVLRETKLGVAVNKLRSHSDTRVASLVKKLVDSWKEQVQRQKLDKRKHASHGTHPPASNNGSSKNTSTSQPGGANPEGGKSARKPDSHESVKFKSDKPRSAKTDNVDINIYKDSTRNSCVEVTYNALVVGSEELPAAVIAAAKDVESVVFAAEKGTTPSYRKKMRSLYMNLKDPRNPTLRQQVVLGAISGERLCSMSPQEMASDELKKEMEEIAKKNLFNAQGAKEQHATTDRFTCSKCKQKKVSYYQMQTRSADEPLTTFCTCENCGNRWKFS